MESELSPGVRLPPVVSQLLLYVHVQWLMSVLCRPYAEMDSTTRGAGRVKDGRGNSEADKAIINTVESIAKKRNVSMAEVALAWSLGSEWVTAPIVGIRSTERLDELLKALELTLSKEEREEIDGHYQPMGIRGHT
jgi:aryl-alcohol dehydrogenase-like predicted oxidoreductase